VKIWYYTLMPWPYQYGEIPYPFPGGMFERDRAQGLYAAYLDLFRRADELGFDGIALAEHHYTKVGTAPSPNLLAAVVATHTHHVKIGLLGNCLPLHGHPVRLAEELAMIDVLSGGRLMAGFIRGGGREYHAFGVDIAEGRAMFEEAWELIVKAWTDPEPFAWHSAHYRYDVVSIVPRPLQQPHPPVLAAGTTAETLEWAAQHHAPLLMGFGTTQQIKDGIAYYRGYAEEKCGWKPGPEDVGLIGPTYVSNSDASAREEAEEAMRVHHEELVLLTSGGPLRAFTQQRLSERSYAYRSAPGREPGVTAETPDYETLARERYYVGSPDTVTQRILDKQKEFGIGFFAAITPFGDMEPPQALRSVELFAKEVLPHLQSG
jgi:alkanesulfonate monooxygenase SsuD/methylene tetrahydromethanopterin reductase-like flavin-dependent oxidoreductase (luciferase family)